MLTGQVNKWMHWMRRASLGLAALLPVLWGLPAAADAPRRPPSDRFIIDESGALQRLPPRPDLPPAGVRLVPDGGEERAAERHPRRLSPEERRQLRRDIHDAGRDLYPLPHRHERREAGGGF